MQKFMAVLVVLLFGIGSAFAGSSYTGTATGDYSAIAHSGDYDFAVVGGAGAAAGAEGTAIAKNENLANAGTYSVQLPGHYETKLVGYDYSGSDCHKERCTGYFYQKEHPDMIAYKKDYKGEGWVYLGKNKTPEYERVYIPGPIIQVQLPAFQMGGAIATIKPKAEAFAFDNGLEAGSVAFSSICGSALAGGVAVGPGGNDEFSKSFTMVGGEVFQMGYAGVSNDNAMAFAGNKSGGMFATFNFDYDKGKGSASSESMTSGGAFTVGGNYVKINDSATNPSAFSITGNATKVLGNPDISKVYGDGVSGVGVAAGGGQAGALSTFNYVAPTAGYGVAASWGNVNNTGTSVTATSGGFSTAGAGFGGQNITPSVK